MWTAIAEIVAFLRELFALRWGRTDAKEEAKKAHDKEVDEKRRAAIAARDTGGLFNG